MAADSQALRERAERAIAQALQGRERLLVTLRRAADLAVSGGVTMAQGRMADLNETVGNLSKKLESQPVIEQAKGILMAHSHCTPDEAFDVLRRASMRKNRKLRLVAEDVVEQTVRLPAAK